MPRAGTQRIQIDFEAREPGAKASVIVNTYRPGYPVFRFKKPRKLRARRPNLQNVLNYLAELGLPVKRPIQPVIQQAVQPMIPPATQSKPFVLSPLGVSPIIEEEMICPIIMVDSEEPDDNAETAY